MAKRKFPNVDPAKKSIRIKFKFMGEWCREKLLIDGTLKNQELAYHRLNDIKNSIAADTFIYQKEFPGSPEIERLGLEPVIDYEQRLFGEVAHDYIDACRADGLSSGTITTYRKSLNKHWLPILGSTPIDKIKYSDITRILNRIDFGSAKTKNNNLTTLRGVFDTAMQDELIEKNPVSIIKNQKMQKPQPDPFSMEETELIIKALGKYDPQVANYFEFAFFAGLRVEELISIEWGDVDFNAAQIRIQRARVGGETKATKTYDIRDVDLNERAMAALHRQKTHTFLADGTIFLNPVTAKPWNDNGKAQRIRYWNPTLKKLGIRHRPPKTTRHTRATMLLMSGCEAAYASAQLGHSIVVFLTVYSKWINTSMQLGQRGKDEEFIEANGK